MSASCARQFDTRACHENPDWSLSYGDAPRPGGCRTRTRVASGSGTSLRSFTDPLPLAQMETKVWRLPISV